MTGYIVDRRLSGGNKSVPNRTRFLARTKSRVAAQVKEMISKGSIGEIFDAGKKITIPVGDISEPYPVYSTEEGVVDLVVSGNHHYRVGDLIPKDGKGKGNGSGNGAGNGGDGNDDFAFTLTRDEFLKYFFEDLELPNLQDKDIAVTEEYRSRKAGYSASGSPSNLSLLQTMKQSTGRRVALRAAKKRKLKELEVELAALQEARMAAADVDHPDEILPQDARIAEIEAEIVDLRKKIKKVPFVDEIDLRYRNTIHDPIPTTQAVMFCLMDVSGSMMQWHKDIAKRYFMLLYLFLHKRYERVEIVFVRHSHVAEEVDEQTFFYDTATGGTIVSTGLTMVDQIIKERYDRSKYNIYVAQASDGDNWGDDGAKVLQLMQDSILPQVQYFFYVEISKYGTEGDLWKTYKDLEAKNFDSALVTDAASIYQVFRKMFGGGDTEPA